MSGSTRDDELARLLAELPSELPPERDLWPELRERIQPLPARRSAVLPLAALVVIGVAAASWLDLGPLEPLRLPTLAGRSAVAAADAPALAPEVARAVRTWEAEVTRAGRALRHELDRGDLPPEQRAMIEARLAEVERSLAGEGPSLSGAAPGPSSGGRAAARPSQVPESTRGAPSRR